MGSHTDRTHSRFGASSAHRWFACPGSVRLCAGIPDRPGPAALEGTRAHELLEALLRNIFDKSVEAYGAGALATKLWTEAPQDMRDAVHVCVDHVKEVVEDHPDAVVLVEQRFEVPVAAAPGEVFGTNDVCVFLPSERSLHVIDYKHGAGVPVAIAGNKQLRFYALGALAAANGLEEFNFARSDWHLDSVCLTIVQPRCEWAGGAVRSEWLPVEDVLAFGPVIGEAVARCKDANAALIPGEEQCRFCPAAASCPARHAQALEAVGEHFGDVSLVTPAQLPGPPAIVGARLAALLAAAPVITSWFGDLEDEARRRMLSGEVLPGLKLVEAQARRQWVSDDATATCGALADIIMEHGSCNSDLVDAFRASKLKTLTEVERILKDGVDRKEARRRLDAMALLTTKKSSGALKVVREDDPRPAADRGAAFRNVDLPHVLQIESKAEEKS